MTQKNDGGPAFPHDVYVKDGSGIPVLAEREFGMSLRDWFAGQALNGIGTWMPGSSIILTSDDAMRARAVWAYRQADAMLAARKGGDT